jgi:hypothetical protein
MLPGAPRHETQTVDTPAGQLIMHMYMVEDAGMAYGVIYSDYPDIVKDADPQTMLDGGRDATVAKFNGKLLSDAPITVNGHPGRETTISAGQMGVHSRTYLVDNRMYSVMVTGPVGKLNSTIAEEVLNSFKLSVSQDIKEICKKQAQFTCVGDCVDGFGEDCFFDSTHYNEADLNQGLHSLPNETKAACIGLHSYAVCGGCHNTFELRKNGVLTNVSCQEFYTAIEDANRTCDGCVKTATAGCC